MQNTMKEHHHHKQENNSNKHTDNQNSFKREQRSFWASVREAAGNRFKQQPQNPAAASAGGFFLRNLSIPLGAVCIGLGLYHLHRSQQIHDEKMAALRHDLQEKKQRLREIQHSHSHIHSSEEQEHKIGAALKPHQSEPDD
jgi:hypothetical protein